MQEDQLIGICGVFLLTFCLIALYHLIGKLGRHDRRYGAQRRRAKEPEQDSRLDHHQGVISGKDDEWLSWGSGPDTRTVQSKSDLRDREERGSWLRS
ncbi:MAG TPA: hypothetical protein VFB82_21125 [Blastocatellia bacterium]|nr:hypothetical protein [Blastocatellia bacterium]